MGKNMAKKNKNKNIRYGESFSQQEDAQAEKVISVLGLAPSEFLILLYATEIDALKRNPKMSKKTAAILAVSIFDSLEREKRLEKENEAKIVATARQTAFRFPSV